MDRAAELRRRQGGFLREARREGREGQIRTKRLAVMAEREPAAAMELEGPEGGLAERMEEWAARPVSLGELGRYLAQVCDAEAAQVHEGLVSLRNVLVQYPGEAVQTVIDSPAAAKVLGLAAQDRLPALQLEACWVLANLLAGSSAQTGALLRRGVVPLLLELTASPRPAVVEHAVWGLGNIASDCAEHRAHVLAADDGRLLRLHARALPGVGRVLVWLFGSICRLRPSREPPLQLEGFARVLVDSLLAADPDDEELESDCVLGLQPCARNVLLHLFLRAELAQRLVDAHRRAAQAGSRERLAALHQLFGALCAGPDEFVELLLRAGMLGALARQLVEGEAERAKEVCWTLSNVALGKEAHVQALLAEPGLLDRLFALAAEAAPPTAKEALWALCNLCKAPAAAQTQLLLDHGLLALFLAVLRGDNLTQRALTLDALAALLQAAAARDGARNALTRAMLDNGVVEAVEQCQYAEEDALYQKAKGLLEAHFDVED